jgi:hypothetical protein
VDLAARRLALHYAEENPDEIVAALDDKIEVVTNAGSTSWKSAFMVALCLIWVESVK